MKWYIGVKMVQAEPMEKDGKEGYKVVYADGYESWSPKEVFEEAYFGFENKNRANNIKKYYKHHIFIESDKEKNPEKYYKQNENESCNTQAPKE